MPRLFEELFWLQRRIDITARRVNNTYMRRRSLIIIITTLLAVLIAFFISENISAPESGNRARFTDGDMVSLKGELACLPHRDQSGPVTLECAYGFKDESGTYYGLQDTTPDQSFITDVPFGEPVSIEGIYRSGGDDKYQQDGTIELKTLIE